MKKYGKSGRPGKRRRNMPGYYLGVNKIGRKSWFANRRPQDIAGEFSREDFSSGAVKVGSIFALSKTSNAIFLGMHRGRVLYYNPKTDRVGHTSFGRKINKKIKVMKERAGIDYFKSENNWMNHRKIPGSDLKVSDVLLNPYRKTIAKKVGDEFTMLDYHESAIVGDVLYGQDSGLKAEIIAITKRGMTVKVFDGSPDGKIGQINLKNRAFRERKYTLVKSAIGQDVQVEELQKKIKGSGFDIIQSEKGGSVAVRRGRPAGSTNRPLTEEEKKEQLDKANKFIAKLDEVSDESIREQLDLVKKVISHSNKAGDEDLNKKYKKIRQQLLYKIGLHDKYDEAETPEQKIEAAKAALKYEERIGGRESAIKMWKERIESLNSNKQKDVDPPEELDKNEEIKQDNRSFEERLADKLEEFKNDKRFLEIYNKTKNELKNTESDFIEESFYYNNDVLIDYMDQLSSDELKATLGHYKAIKEEYDRLKEKNKDENKNSAQEEQSKNFLPKNKFEGFKRLSKDDLSTLKTGEKIFVYHTLTNRIIEVTLDPDGFYRTPVMDKGVPSDKASIAIELRSEVNIPLLKNGGENTSIGKDNEPWHNLSIGDWVNVSTGNNPGLYRIHSFIDGKPQLISKEGGMLKDHSLFNEDFKAVKTPKSPTSALSVIRNLRDQTHLVTHTDRGNLALKIVNYEMNYDDKSESLNIKISLEDADGKRHEIDVNDDKVSKNNIFGVDTSISSMKLDAYKPNYNKDTIMDNLEEYGLSKAMAHLCVPGANNNISIESRLNGKSVDFENKPKLNGIYAGDIIRTFETKFTPSGKQIRSIHNDLFKLPPSLQGGNTAQRLYDNQVKLGKMLGVEYFDMTCALSVGGYAWATKSKGFDFGSKTTARHFRSEFISKVINMTLSDWKEFHPTATQEVMQEQKQEILNRLNAIRRDSKGNPTGEYYYDKAKAHEFAEFTHSYKDENGNTITVGAKRSAKSNKPDIDNRLHHLGKAFMLGSEWDGKKSIKTAKYNKPEWDISTIEAPVPDVYKEANA